MGRDYRTGEESSVLQMGSNMVNVSEEVRREITSMLRRKEARIYEETRKRRIKASRMIQRVRLFYNGR